MSKTPEFRRPGEPRPLGSRNRANYVLSAHSLDDLMMIDYIKHRVKLRNEELKSERSNFRYKVRVYGRYDDLTKTLKPDYYLDWKKRKRSSIGTYYIGMKDNPDILMVYVNKYMVVRRNSDYREPFSRTR